MPRGKDWAGFEWEQHISLMSNSTYMNNVYEKDFAYSVLLGHQQDQIMGKKIDLHIYIICSMSIKIILI